jgi:hypothetical protein
VRDIEVVEFGIPEKLATIRTQRVRKDASPARRGESQ